MAARYRGATSSLRAKAGGAKMSQTGPIVNSRRFPGFSYPNLPHIVSPWLGNRFRNLTTPETSKATMICL